MTFWFLFVPAGLLVLLTLYLLFAKITIEINSIQELYRLQFGPFISFQLVPGDEFKLVLTILGFKKEIKPRVEKQPKAKQKKARKKIAPSKIIGVIKSFKIKTCDISIDTGDMPLNGILYPWCWMLSRRINKSISINFTGQNYVILQLENSIARMLWAYSKS